MTVTPDEVIPLVATAEMTGGGCDDAVVRLAVEFPGTNPQAMVAAAQRYQRLKIWKSTPVIEPAAIDKFEDILVQGHVLEPAKRVKFADLVVTEFAAKAK